MNVYDFDGTIYKGDSSVDFATYVMCHRLKCMRVVPNILIGVVRYQLKKIDTKDFKEIFFSFLKYIPAGELNPLINDFWKSHKYYLQTWYLEKKRYDDVIVSASPQFLLDPIKDILGIDCILATQVNKRTGAIEGNNCKGEEKVKRFIQAFKDDGIEEFYSDSLTDIYLAQMAQIPFFIKKGKIEKWR